MNVLLTGASSGFGAMMAEDLIKAGHKVVGTVRDPEGRNMDAAARLHALGAEIVDIDVTIDSSVEAGVKAAEAKLGHIDVLINNAGIGVHGLQENFTTEDFQKVFEINVFGVQRMARAVLPAMRARGTGLMINVSSLLGRITLPFYGPYNASKWAVEALSENYRTELSAFGIDVAVIEPGGFPTSFFGNVLHPSNPERDASYGEMADAPKAAFEGFADFLAQNPQQDPRLVSEAAVALVGMVPGTRPFRTEVDKVGMADAIKPMNDLSVDVTQGLYSAFGMDGMLTLNTGNAKAA